MNNPIIFIHYGDTPYLKYSLKSAIFFNPDKKIILIGDKKNKKYQKYGVTHIHFAKYDQSESITNLNNNFKYIGGIERQTEQDKRFELFCFKRWGYLYEYLKEEKLDACWYFDSDTLILSKLDNEENKFKNQGITEQSNGSMMKGLIQLEQLQKFVLLINNLFLDEEYLNEQKIDMKKNPTFAFCDMRAYVKFKKIFNPKTIKLNSLISDETHDECICQEDGMEMEFNKNLKRSIKKLYFQNGQIFEREKKSKKFINIKTINMSWVTTSFIEKVYSYRRYGKFPSPYRILVGKISRIPRFILVKLSKQTK